MTGKDEYAIGVQQTCGVSPLCELFHRQIAAEEIRVARARFAAMFGSVVDANALAVTRCASECEGHVYKRIPVHPLPPDTVVFLTPN